MKSLCILLLTSTLTLADETTLQELTSGNNLFTASVYKEIAKDSQENFLVSPFSAGTVLSLVQSGAEGETGEEIRSTLKLPNDKDKIQNGFKELLPTLKNTENYSLHSANKIYVKENFTINDDFKKIATDIYDADLENIDFLKEDEAARTMNQWVEEKTENKIHDLIDVSTLNDRTRAILINALYFKGNWTNEFSVGYTFKKDFYKSPTDVIKVDTMQESFNADYYESSELNARYLELPFVGGDVSMVIVLPNEKDGLAELEKQIDKVLTPPEFNRDYVIVAIPKFKIETKLDFKDILKKLGVDKAFKDEDADLSGIAGDKGDLVISDVIQKTFVNVNERGVEAAAATYIAVGIPLSGIFPAFLPKQFHADHPFIFYIKVKDLIIFVGRVVEPKL